MAKTYSFLNSGQTKEEPDDIVRRKEATKLELANLNQDYENRTKDYLKFEDEAPRPREFTDDEDWRNYLKNVR